MLCTKIHNQISLIFLDEKWQSLEVHTYISKYFLIGKVNFDIKIAKKRLCKISPNKNHTNLITKLGVYFSKYFLVRIVNSDTELM